MKYLIRSSPCIKSTTSALAISPQLYSQVMTSRQQMESNAKTSKNVKILIHLDLRIVPES